MTRICTKCNLEKELNKENFPQREGGLFRRECKSCINKARNARNAEKLKDVRQARQVKLDKELELFENGLKVCTSCEQELRVEQFNKHKLGRFGLESTCKNCRQHAKDKRYVKKQEALRVCKTCGLTATKPEELELFVVGKNNRFGRSPYCKQCRNESDKQKQHNNSLVRRCKKFGITVEQYEQMIVQQENRCAICSKHYDDFNGRGKNFHIDHCHESGEVRGLLCSNCNTGLGQFKDNVKALESAIIYLNK